MMTPVTIPALYTIPFAAMLLVAVAMHARASGAPNVPESRRRIRRANAAVIFVAVPLLVAGTSFIAPETNPRAWVLIWLGNMALLLVTIGLAMLDAMNNIRLIRRDTRRRLGTINRIAAEVLADRPAAAMVSEARGNRSADRAG